MRVSATVMKPDPFPVGLHVVDTACEAAAPPCGVPTESGNSGPSEALEFGENPFLWRG